jgi:GH24 family phage-related lysozyme (muramidase)
MHTSKAGLQLIAGFEGFRPTPYKPVAAERYWTIGYGHYGPDVHGGMRLTQSQALELLAKDVAGRFEPAVRALPGDLTQGQFDALVSFTYNCGPGALQGGIRTALAAGRPQDVPATMRRYVNGASGRLDGLVRRREAEIVLFLHGSHDRATEKATAEDWLTKHELELIREFDRLHRRRTTGNAARRRQLVADMTAQRKRIWHRAQPKAKGGDGRGWAYHHRADRYHSLLVRTD